MCSYAKKFFLSYNVFRLLFENWPIVLVSLLEKVGFFGKGVHCCLTVVVFVFRIYKLL